MYIAGIFFPILSLVFLGLSFLFGFSFFVSVLSEAMVPPMMPPLFASEDFHKKQLKRMQDSFNTKVFLGMSGMFFAILAVMTTIV